MGDILAIIFNSIALVMFIALFIFFWRQVYILQQPVKKLEFFLFVGVFYAIFLLFHEILHLHSKIITDLMQDLYLTISGLQHLIFLGFLQSIYPMRSQKTHLIVAIALFMLELFGIWSNFILQTLIPMDEVILIYFNVIENIGYDGLAIYIYGINGLHIYYLMYTYTKERPAFLLCIAMFFTTVGFLLTFLIDIHKIFSQLSPLLQFVKSIGDSLPIIGLVIFFGVYTCNSKYVFRLPINHYFLMLIHDSGVPIFQLRFKIKGKEFQFNRTIFSGMITAINSLYSGLFHSPSSLTQITNDEISLYLKKGTNISAIIATDVISPILIEGMDQFVKEFEISHQEALARGIFDIHEYRDAAFTFQRIFPYIQIQPIKFLV